MRLKNPSAKGARLERKIKALLELEGFLVFRSAGSHGIFDLCAIGHNKVRLIQAKSGAAKPSKAEKEAMTNYQGPPFSVKELWLWKDRASAPEIHYIDEGIEKEMVLDRIESKYPKGCNCSTKLYPNHDCKAWPFGDPLY